MISVLEEQKKTKRSAVSKNKHYLYGDRNGHDATVNTYNSSKMGQRQVTAIAIVHLHLYYISCLITFRFWSRARVCVCVSVCPQPHAYTIARTWM